jgi:hypothetical protein
VKTERKARETTAKHNKIKNKPIRDTIANTNKKCIQIYGFAADTTKPIWENISKALRTINATTYLQTPINLCCHNLCEKLGLPPGFYQLLGLG